MTHDENAQPLAREEFDGWLGRAVVPLGVDIPPACGAALWVHFELVAEANRHFNLTRITTPAEAAVKHYADSLSLLAIPGIQTQEPLKVLDVGTGAGFPAVPLAILCPNWRVTAIDGTGKKVRFVADSAKTLGLGNLQVHQARAGDWARNQEDRYDLVLLRAVSKLGLGIAEVHQLVRPGGQIVFYKSASLAEGELAEGQQAASKYGLQPLATVEVQLPSPEGELGRKFIRYGRKEKPAPGPKRPGQRKRSPRNRRR